MPRENTGQLRLVTQVLGICFALLLVTGCGSWQLAKQPVLRHDIKSIVVLPPLNRSVEVSAPYTYLSTVTRPLAEQGYYVYPVAVVDTLMKQNGLPTPHEMHAVPLDKIREHIGADAVLYVVIEDWGQKYRIIESKTVVRAKLRLVDTRTGRQVWQGVAEASSGGSSDNIGWQGKLVSALIEQVVSTVIDNTRELARQANERAIETGYGSMPLGPYRASERAQ